MISVIVTNKVTIIIKKITRPTVKPMIVLCHFGNRSKKSAMKKKYYQKLINKNIAARIRLIVLGNKKTRKPRVKIIYN